MKFNYIRKNSLNMRIPVVSKQLTRTKVAGKEKKMIYTQNTEIRLPKSSKKILLILSEAGILTQKDIIWQSGMPAKTARYALKRLDEENLLATKPNLEDMRSSFYLLNPDVEMHLMASYVEEARTVLAPA
jgi:DNA-binding MarR family transcriptional regulator